MDGYQFIAAIFQSLISLAWPAALVEALVKEHQPERYDAISLQLQRYHDRYLKTFPDIARHVRESYGDATARAAKILEAEKVAQERPLH